MRIGLDLRMVGGGSGIARYITELSHQILQQDKTNQYVLFFRRADQTVGYQKYNQKIVIADIAHYSLAEQTRLPRILKAEKLNLVHFPHFNVPLFYSAPFVVTIHDLTHTLFPGRKKSRMLYRLAYNLVFSHAVRSAKKIIAVSNSTKQEILKHFSIPQAKVAVVYEGYNSIYKMLDKGEARETVEKKFGITKPFLLYVGVWRRYKNLPLLARVFDRMRNQGIDAQLVLAGEPDKFYPEIEQEVMNIGHKDNIKAVGRVSDEDLVELYNAAELFVLPSLTEGFGLTALESAVCGTPVAVSDIPTLREIMGQAAEYFDPQDEDNMLDVISHLVQNPQRLEELANAGLRRTTHFSWKLAASETIQIYKEVIK